VLEVRGVGGHGVALRLGHGEDPEPALGERLGAVGGSTQQVGLVGEDRRVEDRFRGALPPSRASRCAAPRDDKPPGAGGREVPDASGTTCRFGTVRSFAAR
jgi:hypothetical protein